MRHVPAQSQTDDTGSFDAPRFPNASVSSAPECEEPGERLDTLDIRPRHTGTKGTTNRGLTVEDVGLEVHGGPSTGE